MKYKIGDKIIVKPWKEMKKNYGRHSSFIEFLKETFEKDNLSRITEVIEIEKYWESGCHYKVKGLLCLLADCDIEGLESEIEDERIKNRFDLLDIR